MSNFLRPKFTPNNLDRYIVRKSILNELKLHLPSFKGTLLDVGCGQMPYKSLILSASSQIEKYIGLDLEDNPIHDNRPDITWQAEKIPLENNVIDCAIATEVFEHCPSPETIMNEIARVLKPNGLLFLTVPFLWPLHEVPFDEYRYTPFSLKRHLSACGFKEIELKPLGCWDASLAQMIALWVRRRKMHSWTRNVLSTLLWPIIYSLYKKDQKASIHFQENLMITGIVGTTRKK